MLTLPLQLLLLFIVGIVVGFINILAGGGSLLALPVLIFLGLPATVANGTNRIAILIQNIAAITGFHRQKVFPWRLSLLAAIPATLGAVWGANLALDIPEARFKQILVGVMIIVLLLTVADPAKHLRTTSHALTGFRLVILGLGFFGVGVFGGFIQAGVGFLIISVMLVTGFDLVATNAVKVLVTFIFTIAALIIFIAHGQVDYLLGVVLGLGSAIGGWVGTRFSVQKGHHWIRVFIIVMVMVFSIKLLWDSI